MSAPDNKDLALLLNNGKAQFLTVGDTRGFSDTSAYGVGGIVADDFDGDGT